MMKKKLEMPCLSPQSPRSPQLLGRLGGGGGGPESPEYGERQEGSKNLSNLLGPLNLAVSSSSWNCRLLAVHMAHFLTSSRSRLKYQFTTKAFPDQHSETPSPPLLWLCSCVLHSSCHGTYSTTHSLVYLFTLPTTTI